MKQILLVVGTRPNLVKAAALMAAMDGDGRFKIRFVHTGQHFDDNMSAAFFRDLRMRAPDWLAQIKSEAGYARVAGVELTLLDSARYFHKAAGIDGLAQIAKDLGPQADSRKLAKAAAFYENAAVRRLGYLLERSGHARQAHALEPLASKAKSMKPLDPSVNPLHESLAGGDEKDTKWKLVINVPVETDS